MFGVEPSRGQWRVPPYRTGLSDFRPRKQKCRVSDKKVCFFRKGHSYFTNGVQWTGVRRGPRPPVWWTGGEVIAARGSSASTDASGVTPAEGGGPLHQRGGRSQGGWGGPVDPVAPDNGLIGNSRLGSRTHRASPPRPDQTREPWYAGGSASRRDGAKLPWRPDGLMRGGRLGRVTPASAGSAGDDGLCSRTFRTSPEECRRACLTKRGAQRALAAAVDVRRPCVCSQSGESKTFSFSFSVALRTGTPQPPSTPAHHLPSLTPRP